VVDFDDVYIDVAEPAAMYDATGEWATTGSTPWATTGCGLPDVNDTDTITITQSDNNLIVVVPDDEGDMTLTGSVYGESYYFKRIKEDGAETEIMYGTFSLSQDTEGNGSISIIRTDGVERCEAGFDIAIFKLPTGGKGISGTDSGGGGGCFITFLRQ